MGSSEPKRAPPAFMYDVDEDDVPIKGSKRSAKKKEEKDKSRPKVSHRRSDEKKLPKSDSGVEVGYPAMMSGARQDDAMVPREIKVERRRSTAGTSSRTKDYEVKSPSKPRAPRVRDEAIYFGIPKQTAAVPTLIAQPLPFRPHSASQSYQSRPTSYHSGYQAVPYAHGPPISSMSFWQQAAPAMSYPPVAPSAGFMQNAAPPSEYIPASPVTPRSLSSRFGPGPPPRTGSGFGYRPVIQQQTHDPYDGYEDGYMFATERTRSRPSIRIPTTRKVIRTKAEVDSEAMPPPARPASARPGPGPSILRRSGEYYADVLTAPEPQFREPQYREPQYRESERERDSRTLYREERAARRPPSVSRPSYDYPDHRVEAANSSRRRGSYYGQSTSTGSGASGASGWEDKAAQATSYQADVSGAAPAAPAPLTTDLLRRQQRRQAGSTRSTKSSGSRDESDYRKSATTRTTRSVSSPEDENVTIKVTGQATVTVGGAQINCEGGEIEIKRQKSLRNGSEWSNSEYGDEPRRIDDRASRIDKPAGRSTRRSVSYSRPSPQYAMGNFI
jgi:hypothetical protein